MIAVAVQEMIAVAVQEMIMVRQWAEGEAEDHGSHHHMQGWGVEVGIATAVQEMIDVGEGTEDRLFHSTTKQSQRLAEKRNRARLLFHDKLHIFGAYTDE